MTFARREGVDLRKQLSHREVVIDLSSKEKAALRNVAQTLKPVAHVGKAGVSAGVVETLMQAFKESALIKVAFKADRDALPGLASEVASATGSVCVGGVGRRRSFYRPLDEEVAGAPDEGAP